MSVLKQHFRVVSALIIREMQARFGKRPGGYLWAVFDPVAHVMVMTAVFSMMSRVPAIGDDFALFFASGYLAFSFYSAMSGFVSDAVKSNKNLFNYPIVSPFDAVIARYLLQLITSMVVTVIIMLVCTSEPKHLNDLDLARCVEAAFAASLLGLGIGMMNLVLFATFPLYDKIFKLTNRPLYLLSGVMVLPEVLPKQVYDIMLWNPLVHVVMWFRSGIYPEYQAAGLDRMYVFDVTCVLITLGLAMFTTSRWIREERI